MNHRLHLHSFAVAVAVAVPLTLTLSAACGSPPPPAPPSAVPKAVSQSAKPIRDPADSDVPLDKRVRTQRLSNGLTYYILPHKKPLARAQLWLAVNAGSVLEDDDQRGLAHLVEHMAFNGTKRFPKQKVVDFMEKAGMQFGADLNAYTSFDQTVYQLTAPTDDKQALDTGLDILREWASELTFEPDEVEKERGVVFEEWRLGRGAFKRIFDKQAPVLFHASRYADRLTIGLPEVIKHAPRDTIVRFYKDWYRPDLMAVIAVGDFDPDVMEAGIRGRFNDLPARPRPRTRAEWPISHDHDLLVSVEGDPEMPYTEVEVYDKLDHRPERSLRDYRRVLVEALYHQMLNLRFEQIARKPDGPFKDAHSGSHEIGRTADVFVRGATARGGHASDALGALFQEVLRVERHGFSPAELERASKELLRRYQRDAKEYDKTDSSEFADEITRLYFTAEAMPGRDAELAIAQKLVPGITLEEENALARSTGRKGRVILVSGPSGEPLPSRKDAAEIAAKIEKTEILPWVDTAPLASLMAHVPAPGKLVKTRNVSEIGVTEWTLSNGVRVVLKPTDFQNDQVMVSGFSPGGTSLVPDKDFDSARFAAEVVNDGGVGEFDAVALQKALTGKIAHASAWIRELEEGIRADGSPADLEVLFQLIHLRFTAPRRDEEAFAAWKVHERDSAAHRLLQPESAFFEDMSSFVASHHKRRAPVTPEVIDKVRLDTALAIYKDRFADASDFTFVIVGNFELEKLRPLVEKYLGSLPVKARKESWKDIGVHFPKGEQQLSVVRGQEPKSFVYFARHAAQPWSKPVERDLHVLEMLLDIRLREVLREDMGGVYFVAVWADASRRPRQERDFGVFFSCDPNNVTRLKDAVVTTVASLQREGPGEVYLEKVKRQIARSQETDLRENHWWVNKLEEAWRFGDDPKQIIDIQPLLERVRADNIKVAIQKYLNSKDSVLAVLRPAKTPGAAAAPAPTNTYRRSAPRTRSMNAGTTGL